MTKIKPKNLSKVGRGWRVTIKKAVREKRGIEEGDYAYVDVLRANLFADYPIPEEEEKKENGDKSRNNNR
uniref:Uncharacterized protein n=1 Tax=viral metagenome TaxID=1070528 RepID=A0A6H1ZT36_9ZZZZ